MGKKFVLSQEDGTVAGGNLRGDGAVDLQTSRSAADQVAGNTGCFIGGGYSNKASSIQSVVVGGQNNTASSLQSFIGSGNSNTTSGGTENAIVGGALNTISGTGSYGFVGAGFQNTVSSGYSVVSGGQSNTASTNTHATVVGGQSNTSSGQYSVTGGRQNVSSGPSAISLGTFNNSSGSYSVTLGQSNLASSTYASAIGAYSIASGFASTCIGDSGNAYLRNMFTTGYGNFALQGDNQSSIIAARKQDTLTTAATTILSLDGTGTTNLIIPSGNRAWNVQIDTISVVTAITGTATGVSVGDVYSEVKNLLFKRIGGTSSIVGTVDTTSIKSNTSMATASLTVTAGASQEMALTFASPSFSGGGSLTIRVVSKLSLVEVAY